MKQHRPPWLSATLIGTAVVCLILLAYGTTFLIIVQSRNRARDGFLQAHQALRETEQARESLEARIDSLRTQVDAVRLQARNEFRLIVPGERIEVIAIDKSPESSQRLVATTLP